MISPMKSFFKEKSMKQNNQQNHSHSEEILDTNAFAIQSEAYNKEYMDQEVIVNKFMSKLDNIIKEEFKKIENNLLNKKERADESFKVNKSHQLIKLPKNQSLIKKTTKNYIEYQPKMLRKGYLVNFTEKGR